MPVKRLEGRLPAGPRRVGIVLSRFNQAIGDGLLGGALRALQEAGIDDAHVTVASVPGALETPLVLQRMAQSGDFDALVALGAGLYLWPQPDAPSRTLAILPFDKDAATEDWFVDGVTNELTTIVAGWRDVQVIGRGTMATYTGRAVDARAIGRELGVRHVLAGHAIGRGFGDFESGLAAGIGGSAQRVPALLLALPTG